MITGLSDYATLNNGLHMPRIGLGTLRVTEGGEVETAVSTAIKSGYRLIDTASIYKNEDGVGEGIRRSGIARDQLFVTTKVWYTDYGYEETLRAYDDSLKKLGLDYVDLYLIHWPCGDRFKSAYKALEKLYKDGKVKAIGVSNFHVHHLEDLLSEAEVVPALNQVECHPLLQQEELRAYCRDKGIAFQAWSPLMAGNSLDHPVLVKLAEKYGKSTSQIILRWDLQNDILTIPKSTNEKRILDNLSVFDFELTPEDLQAISTMNENKRFGPDPEVFGLNK